MTTRTVVIIIKFEEVVVAQPTNCLVSNYDLMHMILVLYQCRKSNKLASCKLSLDDCKRW